MVPAAHLPQPPSGGLGAREGGRAEAERRRQEARSAAGRGDTSLEGQSHRVPRQGGEDSRVHKVDSGVFIRRNIEPARGGDDGGGEPDGHLARQALAEGQHLLRMVGPDVAGGEHDAAGADGRGMAAPGLAGAEAVHLPVRGGADRAGRRHHGQGQVAVRVEAAQGEPVPEQVVVGGEGENGGQAHRRPPGARTRPDRGGEGARRQCALPVRSRFVGERAGQGYGVAVAAHPGAHGQPRRDAAQPAGERDRHGAEHARAVQRTEGDLVADGGPGAFFRQ